MITKIKKNTESKLRTLNYNQKLKIQIIRPEFIFQKIQNQRSNTTNHGTFLSCHYGCHKMHRIMSSLGSAKALSKSKKVFVTLKETSVN